MKTIQEVPIWDNGQTKIATILDTYAVNVALNTSATFWYGLYSQTEDGQLDNMLTQGNITMSGEAYTNWQEDNYAWDWVAEQLNLVITGEYIQPDIIVSE